MYGLTPMSLEEEMKLSPAVKSTRNCKVNIQDDCFALIKIAEAILEYAQHIPEDDDPAHARLVLGYAEGIHSALLTLRLNEGKKWSDVNAA